MIAIGCENISLSFGGETVLDGVGFSLGEGGRLGIVGVNGAGKTSLLRVITGEYTPDSGSVYIARDHTLGVLSQHPTLDPERTVYEEVLSVFSGLIADKERLEELRIQTEAGDTEAADRYAAALRRFDDGGGRTYRSRCRSMLLRFGFDDGMMQVRCSALSGGQKTRLALVRLLLEEPDIMLLDEPTNHLDTATMFWLEEYLTSRKKTVVTVSHDRYFLDRVCTGIFEIEYGKGHYYSGGYTAYTEKKSTDREIQRRHYENQQKEIARIEAYIAQQRRWNRERNIIAAESREKQLAKLERIERPSDLPAASRMSFHESGESGNEVVLARDLCKRYGDKTLFEHLSFLIEKREHVFIYGHNGCGKSTLLRMIAERLRPDSGRVELGYNVTVGYYDQENQHLSDDKTVLDEIWDAYPSLTQNEVRGALARFLFTGDDVGKRVGVLSGGERARLTLTKLMLSEMNLLILDEPTNHLDIISREALEDALADFDGTIIAVSHDRYFISRLATRVLSFDMPPAPPLRGAASDGSIRTSGIYDHRGSYDEYVAAAAAEQRTEAESAQPAQPSEAKQQYLEAKRASQEQRRAENRIRRAKEDCARVEQRLGELEALESQLDPADYTALGELYAERESLETRLLELYEITMDA